jgi:hypothetical protein
MEGIYTQAASLGYPEWAVASLWKLGMAYSHLADVVDATPAPAGASAAEVKAFQQAVKEQVAPLRQRADDALKACLARAGQLDVFSVAVVGCRTRNDTASLPVPSPGAPSRTTALEEARKKAEATLTAVGDSLEMHACSISHAADCAVSAASKNGLYFKPSSEGLTIPLC